MKRMSNVHIVDEDVSAPFLIKLISVRLQVFWTA